MSLQDLVIVTGMSGSGKGTVLNAFEDFGFFCIDNLPILLLPRLIEAFHVSGGQVERVALGIDIRAGEELRDFEKSVRALRRGGIRLFVLFLEARAEVLLRRFSETRRPHPLAEGRTLREAIQLERRRMAPIRDLADLRIDTSTSTPHQAKALVGERFRRRTRRSNLLLNLLSFGFKHGIPLETDILLDVRFLPNPHFVKALRSKTGKDPAVTKYILASPDAREFIARTLDYIQYLIPFYMREGKSYLTIAVGCTGGRHRSVFIVEELGRRLKPKNAVASVRHRDLVRPS